MINIKPKTETEALFRDLDKPSLHALSYVLRHPDTWPETFIWNYSNCTQCAMGLAHHLWKVPPAKRETGPTIMAHAFAMPYTDAYRIFLGKAYSCQYFFGLINIPIPNSAITPDMVADQIDQYLARVE